MSIIGKIGRAAMRAGKGMGKSIGKRAVEGQKQKYEEELAYWRKVDPQYAAKIEAANNRLLLMMGARACSGCGRPTDHHKPLCSSCWARKMRGK